MSKLAVASVVCLAALFCPLAAPIAAMILGTLALRRIAASGGALGGRRLALAGLFLGSLLFIIEMGGLLAVASTLGDRIRQRVQQSVETFINEATAQRPDAALAVCAPDLARNRSQARLALDAFGRQLHERYGPLLEFRVVSETHKGTLLAPVLEVAAHYRFVAVERSGWVRMQLAPGGASLVPQPLLEAIVIEDHERGELKFPP